MVPPKEPLSLLLILLLCFRSVVPNPVTKLTYLVLKDILEQKLNEAYPSDDADDYADTLQQDVIEKKNATVYHLGNPKYPIFMSHSLANTAQKLHLLLRGEDYLPPKDRNNFVVLRQTSTPKIYSCHLAHVSDMDNPRKAKITWNDALIFQQKNLKNILNTLGNKEVQGRSLRGGRGRCSWLGTWLMCDAIKTFKPLRERQPRKPIDVIMEVPARPGLSIVSDENGGILGGAGEGPIGKNKRQIIFTAPSRRPPPPPTQAPVSSSGGGSSRSGNSYRNNPPNPSPSKAHAPPPTQPPQVPAAVAQAADVGDGISEEDRAIVFKQEEKARPEVNTAPAGVAEDKPDAQGILVPVQKEKAPGSNGKKKKHHKKKHNKQNIPKEDKQ